jgi:hypothetical protein
MAELFNDFFISTPLDLIQNSNFEQLPSHDTYPSFFNNSSMYMEHTNVTEVIHVINGLKNSKACDIYDVSALIIKPNAQYIANPITHIFNASVDEGVFPCLLKIGKVIPVYKKDDPLNISNYRPISLLPIISKVFEQPILIRLNKFLNKFNIITNSQHGFRENHSTTTAAFNFLEKIYPEFDKRSPSLGLFIDLSKAFDLVDHQILLSKLFNIGVRGVVLQLFDSYLSERKQCVLINNTSGTALSGIKEVNIGVPQGSMLGPVLYIIYVNDFNSHIVNCHSTQYADDASSLVPAQAGVSLLDAASKILVNIKQWFSSHKLVTNESKSNVMCFLYSKSCNEQIEIVMTHLTLASCDHVKFLGFYINSKLNWNEHINHLCKKLATSSFTLRFMRDKIDQRALVIIYYALFQSHLKYGIIFWGNASVHGIQRLLLVQKKAIRVLAQINYRDSRRAAFANLQIMTVINIYLFETFFC